MENLGINRKFMSEDSVSDESVTDIIKKFQNHPSIIKLKKNHQREEVEEEEDIDREIDLLGASKAIQQNDIPVKINKANRNIIFKFIIHNFNKSIFTARFPRILKGAEVKPVFKKKFRIDKENYRPVSIYLLFLKYLKD